MTKMTKLFAMRANKYRRSSYAYVVNINPFVIYIYITYTYMYVQQRIALQLHIYMTLAHMKHKLINNALLASYKLRLNNRN